MPAKCSYERLEATRVRVNPMQDWFQADGGEREGSERL